MLSTIFENGCLIQLSFSIWGAQKKLSIKSVKYDVDEGWVKAHKKLVDPKTLKPIRKVATAARNHIASLTLPFPIDGFLFIPRDLIPAAEEKLSQYKDEFFQEFLYFKHSYDTFRDIARFYLKEFYKDTDYPFDISTKFGFSWRFVLLDIPGSESRILPAELYNSERSKFMKLMDDAKTMAIEALRTEFTGLVDHMIDRLSPTEDGECKKFHKTLTSNFYNFFNTFQQRNIFNDETLSELVERAKSVLNENSTYQLRGSGFLRANVTKGMETIKAIMDSNLVDIPKRKIRMS